MSRRDVGVHFQLAGAVGDDEVRQIPAEKISEGVEQRNEYEQCGLSKRREESLLWLHSTKQLELIDAARRLRVGYRRHGYRLTGRAGKHRPC